MPTYSPQRLLVLLLLALLPQCSGGARRGAAPQTADLGSSGGAAPLACGSAWPDGAGAPRPCRKWTLRCNATRLGVDARSATRWTRHPTEDEPTRYALRVNLPGCGTSALTSRNVASCLRGRHVAFFGDSLTRYQYISLALFLEYGAWAPPPGVVAPRAYEYVLGWGGYNGLSKAVAERLRGHEICDCHRPAVGGRQGPIFETRYYYHPVLNVRLTFVWRPGTLRMAWHNRGWIGAQCQDAALQRARIALTGGRARPPPPVRCPQSGCRPGACSAAVHRGRHVVPRNDFEGAALVLAQLRPDAAVFNVGLWTRSYAQPATLSRLVALGDELRARLGPAAPLLVWRTTTARQAARAWEPQPAVAAALAAAGWTIVDAGGATTHIRDMSAEDASRFYYDNSHFKRFVYRGINELILTTLCSASTVW